MFYPNDRDVSHRAPGRKDEVSLRNRDKGSSIVKSNNQSKVIRERRPRKPDFALTGVVVGLVVGWLAGFIAEIAMHQFKMLIMASGGFVGVLLGSGFEAIRLGWRTYRYRRNQKS